MPTQKHLGGNVITDDDPLQVSAAALESALGFEIADIAAADHDFAQTTRGLSFGTAGTLDLVTEDGTDETVPSGALAAGVIHPIRVVTVKQTSAAVDIVGWF